MSVLHDGPSTVNMAGLTTLAVGGPVDRLLTPLTEGEAVEIIAEAASTQTPLHVVGGGSNMLVSDDGLDGVVMQSADYAIDVRREDGAVEIDVGAGVEWDEFVAFCVDEGFAGVECLSGIPGKVGAAPIQNIGAYGQEVAETITAVRAVDFADGTVAEVPADAIGFGYRTSRFKTEWRGQRFVSSVRFELRPGGPATVAYPGLVKALGLAEGAPAPPLARVREAVLSVRRSKSMVYDKSDPNHRSAGSFFTNPIVDAGRADAVAERAAQAGIEAPMPRYDTDGRVKLSAAWLIEQAGFEKGFQFGAAGLSTKHCLAVVNRGRASALDIVALAAIVRRGVRATFGVTLEPEPVFLGFSASVDDLLG